MSGLSDPERLASVNALLGDLPDGPGGSGVVEVVVTGDGSQRVALLWVVEHGRLVAVESSADSGRTADVSIPQGQVDLGALLAGDFDPAVAYMRGDLKPEGSVSAFFAWLSALARPECRRVLARA
ncbi:MAG: hypothetical protein ACLFWR_03330 [Acidimicrobiales bacterium]